MGSGGAKFGLLPSSNVPRRPEALELDNGVNEGDYHKLDADRSGRDASLRPFPPCRSWRLVFVYTLAGALVVGGIAAAIFFLSLPSDLCIQAYNRTNVGGDSVAPIRLGVRLCPHTPKCVGGVCFEDRNGAKGLVVYTERSTRVRLAVENALNEATLIHWHGLDVPYKSDGVPGITQPAIPPGGRFRYDFQVPKLDSTHFLHSHFKWQHQQGLSAFFLILSGKPADDKEVVVFLEDRQPQHPLCYAGDPTKCNPALPMPPVDKLQTDLMENDGKTSNLCLCPALSAQWPSNRTCSCSGRPRVGAVCEPSRCQLLKSRNCPPCPDLTGADFSDTEDEAYNFCRYPPQQQPSQKWLHARYGGYWQAYDELLVNGKSLLDPEIVEVSPGDSIKLRIINSAGSVCFWVNFPPGLNEGEVLAVDGMPVKRGVHDRSFPVCPGQRMDVRLQVPKKEASWSILAQWAGEKNQTGFILRAGNAQITNLPPLLNDEEAVDTNFDMERRLETAMTGSVSEGRVAEVNLTSGWLHGYSLNHRLWNVNPSGKDGLGMSAPNPWPIKVTKGESLCFLFVNQGLVGHPMHLHGHSFKVVELDGRAFNGAVRDTLQVPPRCHRAKVCARMENVGVDWLLHCHMIGK